MGYQIKERGHHALSLLFAAETIYLIFIMADLKNLHGQYSLLYRGFQSPEAEEVYNCACILKKIFKVR